MPPRKESHLDRLQRLWAYDVEMTNTHQRRYVFGVDEVGRGSLVGPVVAAAYCFTHPPCVQSYPLLAHLDDSKASHLNHAKRVALAQVLQSIGAWGLGEASPQEIAQLNIVKASLLAGHRALQALLQAQKLSSPRHSREGGNPVDANDTDGVHSLIQATSSTSVDSRLRGNDEVRDESFSYLNFSTAVVLMDGKQKIPQIPAPQQAVIKGDSHSASIAAASIIAKAHRDERLIAWAQEYPQYGWETNAGYPTPGHQQAILDHGITPLHRTSYKQIRDWLAESKQLSLLP